jgi:hypothetical protein
MHGYNPGFLGDGVRKIKVQGQSAEKCETLYEKQKDWGMAQFVQQLPSKHEDLSLILCVAKN